MSIQGATVTVAAGAVSAVVTGSFAAAYQVALSASWVTDVDIVSRTAAGFTVNFSVPAPAAGGTFDWIVSDSTVSTSQAITSATATVSAAGSVSETFTPVASLPASYQVGISTSWVTAYDVVKAAAGFTVNFAVPAPNAAATWDYIIFGPAIGTVTLADYLDELRDLLHDPNDRFWSPTQKANYINRARKRRDLDTAIQRSTISFTLTAGTDTYTFATVGNGSIVDVIAITLIFGQTRIVLDNPSLTELNQRYRVSANMTGWTSGWARQGPTTVIFGPNPGSAYVTEWDCVVFGAPLVSLTDADQVPYPYTQPAVYYAAYLAKLNERQWDEAAEFKQQYDESIGVSTNARAPRVPNSYTGLGQWR